MSEWKDGLPPVGELVIWCEHQEKIIDCLVIGYDGDGVVVRVVFDGRYVCINPKYLRHLKSEAELKREEDIFEIIDAGFITPEDNPKDVASRLHEAGYRKVNELTDEAARLYCERLDGDSAVYFSSLDAIRWARSQIIGG